MALGLLDDARVTALGLHIEGFDSIRGFEILAAKAREMMKPIVVMKIGRSRKAREAAFTHTASLAGSDDVADAFLKRLGIARVNSIPSMLETLKLLHIHGPLDGFDISSMSCSGGEASLMADASFGRKINFRALSKQQKKPLADALGEMVSINNPLDYHTYVWGDREGMQATFNGMLEAGFDLNCLVLDYPRADHCEITDWEIPTNALIGAAVASGAKAAIISTLQENLNEQRARQLIEHNIAPMLGIEESLDAIEAAAFIGTTWNAKEAEPLAFTHSKTHERPDTSNKNEKLIRDGIFHVPDEARAKQILARNGVIIPKGIICLSVEQAETEANKLGYPVVIKALGIAHKSEVDAVRLDIRDGASVKKNAHELLQISDHIYVEEQITFGLMELLVGLTSDAQFGLVMSIATGGTMVEVFDDTQTLLLPADKTMIANALMRLKSRVFFDGFRSKPKADLEATIHAIMAIQKFALQNHDRVIELDINPLIIGPSQHGAVAADVLIKYRSHL